MKPNKSERTERRKKRLKQVVVDFKWPVEMGTVEGSRVEEDMRGTVQAVQNIEETVTKATSSLPLPVSLLNFNM